MIENNFDICDDPILVKYWVHNTLIDCAQIHQDCNNSYDFITQPNFIQTQISTNFSNIKNQPINQKKNNYKPYKKKIYNKRLIFKKNIKFNQLKKYLYNNKKKLKKKI